MYVFICKILFRKRNCYIFVGLRIFMHTVVLLKNEARVPDTEAKDGEYNQSRGVKNVARL